MLPEVEAALGDENILHLNRGFVSVEVMEFLFPSRPRVELGLNAFILFAIGLVSVDFLSLASVRLQFGAIGGTICLILSLVSLSVCLHPAIVRAPVEPVQVRPQALFPVMTITALCIMSHHHASNLHSTDLLSDWTHSILQLVPASCVCATAVGAIMVAAIYHLLLLSSGTVVPSAIVRFRLASFLGGPGLVQRRAQHHASSRRLRERQ